MATKKCTCSDDSELHENMEAELSLPVEKLKKVFYCLNLTHTEKLICRLVCKNWNTAISSCLTKTSRYVLGCRNSHQILLDSIVQWTSIRISDYGSSALTHAFRNRITALQLDLSGFPDHSTTWKILLLDFPNVTTLHLNIDDDKAEQEESKQKPRLTQNEENQFKGLLRNLENLSVTFPFHNYNSLNEIMSTLSNILCWPKTGSLTKFIIRENWSAKPGSSSSGKYDSQFSVSIFRIINSSCHALKFLELDFCSREIRGKLIPGIVPDLCKMDGLKLKSLLIHHEPISEYVERDFALLHELVQIQASTGVLKNIILPWSSNASLCQELVGSLPRDIESVGNVRKQHITQEFPFQFKKLKWLSVGGLIEDIFNQQCVSVQELQANVKKYGFSFNRRGKGVFHQVMTKNFPNLTVLKVIGNGGSLFVDQDLQKIILYLKKLRVLHIETCGITDFGVTGAEENDSNIQDLVTTKRLYLLTKPFPRRDCNSFIKAHCHLNLLKNLEKLVLVGTKITDVGIVLGFRFGSTLKQLTFASESSKVSDLGLHCLAVNNHGLEGFQGSFKSPEISNTGIAHFKEQLPLIKSSQQFKVVNVKPV